MSISICSLQFRKAYLSLCLFAAIFMNNIVIFGDRKKGRNNNDKVCVCVCVDNISCVVTVVWPLLWYTTHTTHTTNSMRNQMASQNIRYIEHLKGLATTTPAKKYIHFARLIRWAKKEHDMIIVHGIEYPECTLYFIVSLIRDKEDDEKE